jgi:hypothetical protein
MKVKIEKQHEWLQKFVGEWTYETDATMGPDQPPLKMSGSETVRSIGGIWIVGESQCEMPGGSGVGTMQLTLGYDPQKGKFVGTWLGSMMTYLWVYAGTLDAAGEKLTLETVGPNCEPGGDAGKTANFREVVEMRADGQRFFSSSMQQPDGSWNQLMTTRYTRVK